MEAQVQRKTSPLTSDTETKEEQVLFTEIKTLAMEVDPGWMLQGRCHSHRVDAMQGVTRGLFWGL